MRGNEADRQISARKLGRSGSLSRACFDERHDDCGLRECQCHCHRMTAADLREMVYGGGGL